MVLALALSPASHALPDLIITDIRIYEQERNIATPHDESLPDSDAVVAGDEYIFYATIQNIGYGASPEGVIHGVSFWVDGEAVNWSDDWEGPLAPGESRHLRATGGPAGSQTWTPAESGERAILVWVDDIDRIEEADEENNRYGERIVVLPLMPPVSFRAVAVDTEDRESFAHSLNDSGWVGGSIVSGQQAGVKVATIWRRTVDGWIAETVAPAQELDSRAAAINNLGEVAVAEKNGPGERIFRWSRNIGHVEIGAEGAFRRMDDRGWILTTMEIRDREGERQAIIYDYTLIGGGFTDFASNGQYLVGWGSFSSKCEYLRYELLPFIGASPLHSERDCTLPHPLFEAVNNFGDAVGRGGLYSSATRKWTSFSPSVGVIDINDRREIIGEEGYVWVDLRPYHITDLLVNPNDFTAIQLVAVNENSEIAANGIDSSGQARALILLPVLDQVKVSFEKWLGAEGIPEEEWSDWKQRQDPFTPPLLRFAAGWPVEGAIPQHLRPRVEPVGDGDITFLATLRENSEGVRVFAEESEDLLNWKPLEEGPIFIEWVEENVKRVAWQSNSAHGGGKQFFRLRAVELLPDLIVTDVRIYERQREIDPPHGESLPDSDAVVAGDEYIFYATIQNIGDGASPEGVIHGVSFWVNGEAVNWSDDWEGPLAPGESRHLRANGGPAGSEVWTPAESGEREILVWVDDIDRIEEADEENNRYWRSRHVGPDENY